MLLILREVTAMRDGRFASSRKTVPRRHTPVSNQESARRVRRRKLDRISLLSAFPAHLLSDSGKGSFAQSPALARREDDFPGTYPECDEYVPCASPREIADATRRRPHCAARDAASL